MHRSPETSSLSASTCEAHPDFGVDMMPSSTHETTDDSCIESESDSTDDMDESDCCVQDIRWMCHSRAHKSPYPSMISVQEDCIDFQSTCEHHLLPFHGRVYIGYSPKSGKQVIGSNQLREIVRTCSHRLQLQERITRQIADVLEQLVDPTTLVVVSQANHMCMVARGAQSHSSTTISTIMRGSSPSALLQRAAPHLEEYAAQKRARTLSRSDIYWTTNGLGH